MASKFNPPPNWPAPPTPGWTPPAGWTPPVEWGPVPDGWQLWIEEPAKPSGGIPRWAKITGVVVAVLLVIGVIGSLGDSGDETTPAASDVTTAPADAATEPAKAAPSKAAESKKAPAKAVAPAGAGIGDKVRDGKFEFTVVKVKPGVKSIGPDGFQEKAQGQFVLVTLRVENIGDEPQTFVDSAQKGFDGKGREVAPDSTAGIYIEDNEVFFEEINPGNTVKGQIVFDIPKGATLTGLELHDSLFSGGVKVSLK